MILSMRMKNIALIEQLEIGFHQGMHVLTGETGAGKSIVVDAVNLVLGGRADRDLIRTGCDKASVEADFDTAGQETVTDWFRAQEIDCEDGFVTLYREISRTGRNICRVCGVTVSLSLLKELAALLMDVHGQHEHQFLMDPQHHLHFLDNAGDDAHHLLMKTVAESCEAFLVNHRAYARLVKENEVKQYRMESLQKSLTELKKAALKNGEEEALTQEKEASRNSQKISDALHLAHGALASGEEREGILSRVKDAMNALQSIRTLGEQYESVAARCENTYYELEELSYDIAVLTESGEFDPERAEYVESRLDLIRRLERKYGSTIGDILENQQQMQDEYDRYESMDQEIARMGAEHKKLLAAYRQAARNLTASRKALAARFEQNMMQQLRDLGMEKTVFSVSFGEHTGKQPMPQTIGDDLVEFMISPNPGEPLKPLGRIASGGELSRLMLAIKSLEAAHAGVGCMVFDEIDTGISGRAAQVVAVKMAAIARDRQVICVTHLPQLAAMADHEYLVVKQVQDGRTNTSVRLLSIEERITEVARMMGGADGSDDSALSHAKSMLEAADKIKKEEREAKPACL